MEKKTEVYQTETEILGLFGLVALQFGSIFYKIFLAMLTWNMFVSDFTITMGYWQMFLATMVFNFMFGGLHNKLEVLAKINQVSGKRAKVKLGVSESYKVIIKSLLINTIAFAILYIIYLII